MLKKETGFNPWMMRLLSLAEYVAVGLLMTCPVASILNLVGLGSSPVQPVIIPGSPFSSPCCWLWPSLKGCVVGGGVSWDLTLCTASWLDHQLGNHSCLAAEASSLHVLLLFALQGLTHLGKGTLTLCPYHSDRQLMSQVAVAGLLTVLVSFLDVRNSKYWPLESGSTVCQW